MRGKIQLHRLGHLGQVGDAENGLALPVRPLMLAQIGKDAPVRRRQHAQAATAEGLELTTHRQQPAHPIEQRMRIALLGLDVDRLKAVQRVHHRRQHQAGRIGLGESAVAVAAPLHRRAHAVAVTQVDVVAHAYLVAVIDHRGARHRQQQAVEQLHAASVALHQGRQATPNAQVDPRPAVGGVVVPEVVTLLVGDHLERQLIVVAQEDRPLAVGRNFRGLAQDVVDREAVFLGQGHVHARHQREVEGHVAFIAVLRVVHAAEVRPGVLRPLVGLGQQHAVGVDAVQLGADLAQHLVGFRQVLVVGAVAFDQVGNRVQAQAVDTHVEPEAHHPEHRAQHLRVVEVEVRLVRVEAMPEVGAGHRVPGPVAGLGVEEDDPRAVILLVGVGPDVVVARRRAGLGAAGALEPGVLIGGVVDDQLGDHPQTATVRLLDETPGLGQGAVIGADRLVFADVVAIVAPRRGIERQQPECVHAEVGDVVELGG